jgi:hypothetical protein
MYTPSRCFDTEDLQNGTVTAGLRCNPSHMATLKRGNNRNHQLTGKNKRPVCGVLQQRRQSAVTRQLYIKKYFIKKPLLLIYLMYTHTI